MTATVGVAVVILAVAALGLIGLALRCAYPLLHGRREPLRRTPGDYGLAYEEISFPSTDGLTLRGWWIPGGEQPAAAILCHPMFGNRAGLAAANLDLLAVAASLHLAGYSTLLFDFRGHGESQAGLCAGGLTEDQDVAGAVEYAFARYQGGPARIGVIGFGMGAAAAVAAIGRQKGGAEVIRVFNGDMEGGVGYVELQPPKVKKLDFLVAVQPASLGALTRGYLRWRWGIFGLLLFPLVDQVGQALGGYPLNGDALLKYTREVHVHTLYIQACQDEWGGCRDVERMFAAAPDPKQLWWIEEAGRWEGYVRAAGEMKQIVEWGESREQSPGY